MEDALISPESFSILSGAGLIEVNEEKPVYVHTTSQIEVKQDNTIVLPQEACWNHYSTEDSMYKNNADIFVMVMKDGSIDEEPCIPAAVAEDHKTLTCYGHHGIPKDTIVLVDYYVKRTTHAQVIEITADKFGGSYYVEASCLFRDEKTQTDMPAEFVIPSAKVQSNFTFTMANSGDPSTFSFVLDAMPDYTKFDGTRKVLAELQVITDDVDAAEEARKPCHLIDATTVDDNLTVEYAFADSANTTVETLTVSGTNIDGTTANGYNTELFPNVQEKDVTELQLKFEEVKPGKIYRIKQTNPALVYYPGDANITGEVKDRRDYSGDDLAVDTYSLLLTNDDGKKDVTVELYEMTENGPSDGTFIRKIVIKNKVNFATRINTKSTQSPTKKTASFTLDNE